MCTNLYSIWLMFCLADVVFCLCLLVGCAAGHVCWTFVMLFHTFPLTLCVHCWQASAVPITNSVTAHSCKRCSILHVASTLSRCSNDSWYHLRFKQTWWTGGPFWQCGYALRCIVLVVCDSLQSWPDGMVLQRCLWTCYLPPVPLSMPCI